MAYPPAFAKELKKHWTKVLKKGGYFALTLNGYPADRDRFPILGVHPTKVMDKAKLKKLDTENTMYYQKLITGRIENDGEVKFWIDDDSKVKSPMLLRKALKRLAEVDELGSLTPKISKLRKSPIALQSEAKVDGDVVDTDAARRGGGKSKLKKALGVGVYAELLGKLEKWNKRFARGVKASQLDGALRGLHAIRDQAQGWLDANRDGKNERRAEVQSILTKTARAEDKLARLRQSLRESADVDALLEEDRPLSAQEETRVARNLQARLQAAADDDERAELLEALRGLPSAVQDHHGEARARVAALDDTSTGQERTDAQNALAAEQQRAMKLLTTYRAARGGARDVIDVTGDGRLAGADAVSDALGRHVDAMLALGVDLAARPLDDQMQAIKDTLASFEERGDAQQQGRLEARLIDFALDQTVADFLEALDGRTVEDALGTLGRGTTLTTKTRTLLAERLTTDTSDRVKAQVSELLGEHARLPAPTVDPEGLNIWDERAVAGMSSAIDGFLAGMFDDPGGTLGPRMLAFTGELYARVAADCDPRMAASTLNDLVFLRWINPLLTKGLRDPSTGSPPRGVVVMASVVQCVFNNTTPNLPQFVDLAARWAKQVPTFWVRLLKQAIAANPQRDAMPALPDALAQAVVFAEWKDITRAAAATTLSASAELKAFVDGKTFVKNPATGKKDAELAALCAQAKQQVAAYKGALWTLRAFDPIREAADDFEAACRRWRRDVLYPAQDHLSVTEGLLSTLGAWRLRVQSIGADAAYGQSPLKASMDALNEAVSAENHRVASLEQAFERRVEGTRD